MAEVRRTFKRPAPFVAVLAAYALFFASFQNPIPQREPAATGILGLFETAATLLDSATHGYSDMQLYSAGNWLLVASSVAALGAAYTWRRAFGSPIMRARRTAELIPLNNALQATLRAAGGTSYGPAREAVRAHIRSIDAGIPHRNEILRLLRTEGEEAVDAYLLRNLAAINADPNGKVWAAKYSQLREPLRVAKLVELNAKGVAFAEASEAVIDSFKTGRIPVGLPHQAEYRLIDSPDKFQRWLQRSDVQAFLQTDRADVVAWDRDLKAKMEKETKAFEAMQTHYNELALEVTNHLAAVDRKGTGMAYMARLIQPQIRYGMDRYSHEPYGSIITNNDGDPSPLANARRVQEEVGKLDKRVRGVHQAIRTENVTACWQRFEFLAMTGVTVAGVASGWLLRHAADRRLVQATGSTGAQHEADKVKQELERAEAARRDAVAPPAVAARLARARADVGETELRDLYATLRRTMRKPEHLPRIAEGIRNSGFVDKAALDAAEFDRKLTSFLEDDDKADAVIDAAIADLTRGKASDVAAIKDLLFGQDGPRETFREEVRNSLYASIVHSRWPTVVINVKAIGIDEEIFRSMNRDSKAAYDTIAARHRGRPAPPVPSPTPLGGR